MHTVLLVEDEQGIAEILRLALGEAGYRLDHATTLAGARDLLARDAYDAILLDLNLLGFSGLEALPYFK